MQPNRFSEDDLADVYDTNGIPFYVLMDKQGTIIGRWNYMAEEQLAEVRNLLERMK